MDRVPTGIAMLDRHLDGGLKPGSITGLVAPPASQVNPLFYSLLENRSWLYVSTYRSERAVVEELSDLLSSSVDVEHVGVERPARNLNRALNDLNGNRHVIVDTMNPIEEVTNRRRYTALLNGLKEYLLDSDRIAVLHCTRRDGVPPLRETTLTMTDVVWQLDLEVSDTNVENRMIIPKYRSRRTVDEVIKLDLGQEVTVDNSRNIA